MIFSEITVVFVVVFAVSVIVTRFRSIERGIAVAGLPLRERIAVWRSVWSGRAVRDPNLSAPAIELAHRLDLTEGRREQKFTKRRWRWPFAALALLSAVLGLSTHSWFSGAVSIFYAGYFLVGIRWSYRRADRKRAASVVANQVNLT